MFQKLSPTVHRAAVVSMNRQSSGNLDSFLDMVCFASLKPFKSEFAATGESGKEKEEGGEGESV